MTRERLLQIARKMHLYIFLHSQNEQEIYDELGLTEEENRILGYSRKIKIKEPFLDKIKKLEENK